MFRVRILCEDRRTARFLRRLCELRAIRVPSVEVAPSGSGGASEWVFQRSPGLMRQRRSRNFQAHLGLIVHIDGDNQGVSARKAALDARLEAARVPFRGPHEPVAVFVPTWCIETWVLHLSGIARPPESAKLKRDPDASYRSALRELEESEASSLRIAAGAWNSLATVLPSLLDARIDGRRIGLP